ncbi:hypothetical protein E3N88_12042 [Mikania micrantha]|uniref:Uncharacterized protein n=1 Tax=Mikania micrantha TaxID=192012 RepID=A0A5N6P6D1_9ASTR|nr:hypothetical protein E3N88_12042 [Mikania micrantha]
MLTGGHNECKFDVDVRFSDDPRRQTGTVEFRMSDNNEDTRRNPGKRPAENELTDESRQRVRDIMSQADAVMAEQACIAKRARSWTWYPFMVWDWIVEEKVPHQRVITDDDQAHRLPALGVSSERAFAALVSRTARKARKACERDEEIRALREENQHLRGQLDHMREQVVDEIAALRNWTAQLDERHREVAAVVQDHGEWLVAVEDVAGENQAALQNAWADQLLMEPEEEPDQGPQFEAEDLEEGDFDEDPDEDPEVDDDDGPADSGDSHSTTMLTLTRDLGLLCTGRQGSAAKGCSFKAFLSCHPRKFQGTEGAVGLL